MNRCATRYPDWMPLVLLGCSFWLIVTGNGRLFARESADVAAALPEPGGVRELPAAASQAIPLANPGFEQQWDGWTPRDQEGFSIETQPGAAHSGQASAISTRSTTSIPAFP